MNINNKSQDRSLPLLIVWQLGEIKRGWWLVIVAETRL